MLSFVAITFAFALSAVSIRLLAKGAPLWGLVDKPNNHHKQPLDAVPMVGGIGIFLGVNVAVVVLSAVLW